ncbi:hypothetical protein PIB30_017627 [Stylosanthes scabra]|uniref:Uncharacterized protein n=1 Tax=Stylosanthes scabra TaxID=79078 RepID=A0ABU6W756_9FABA|nr:hypothetical protein [Stylosanthes scabra]
MPCVQACAALMYIGKNHEDQCHGWLTMDAYRATYRHAMYPIPGHTKRSCTHKKNDDDACAEVAATEAAKKKGNTANVQIDGVASNHVVDAATGADLANEPPITEIDITQPNYSQRIIVEDL